MTSAAESLSASRAAVRRRDRWWRTVSPYVFISPFYITFLIFGLLPIGFSLVVSLTNWRGTARPQFIGLQNYATLLQDPGLPKALLNTVYVWIGSVPTMIFLALIFAVILNSRLVRGRNAFRTVYFLPQVTSLVITGLVFGQLFSTSFGLVNTVLVAVGGNAINWLADPRFMKAVLVMALVWRWVGNDMVIMLAGLNSIPGDIYEAAIVDGASGVQSFFFITVPLMRPVILFDFVITTIGIFGLFAEPFVLFGPGGGVKQAGLVTGTLIYQYSFQLFKFGYGAAVAWVVGVIIIFFSMLQLRLGNREAT